MEAVRISIRSLSVYDLLVTLNIRKCCSEKIQALSENMPIFQTKLNINKEYKQPGQPVLPILPVSTYRIPESSVHCPVNTAHTSVPTQVLNQGGQLLPMRQKLHQCLLIFGL